MSARAKSPAAATRPAPQARSGAAGPPERSEWWGRGRAQGGLSVVAMSAPTYPPDASLGTARSGRTPRAARKLASLARPAGSSRERSSHIDPGGISQ